MNFGPHHDDLIARELQQLADTRRVMLAFQQVPRGEKPPDEIVQQGRSALRALAALLDAFEVEAQQIREVRDEMTGVLYDRVTALTIDSIAADGGLSPTQVRRAASTYARPRRARPRLPEDLSLDPGATPVTYRTPDGYAIQRHRKAWQVFTPAGAILAAPNLHLACQAIERNRAGGAAGAGNGTSGSLDVPDASPSVTGMSDVPLDRPNVARMYDYLLGGTHNFAVDRATVEMVRESNPEIVLLAKQSRGFMGRAVRLLSRHGILQFLDIGSGIPTRGNVHEIAQGINPRARVVYVDNDPQAVTYAKDILDSAPGVDVLVGDLRQPGAILGDARTRALIDFSKPVAVLIVATLHFVDDSAFLAVDELVKTMVPGSYLVISHLTSRPDEYATAARRTADRVPTMHTRTPEQIEQFFAGLVFESPGLVEVRRWRPDTPRIADAVPEGQTWMLAGVARKPPLESATQGR